MSFFTRPDDKRHYCEICKRYWWDDKFVHDEEHRIMERVYKLKRLVK